MGIGYLVFNMIKSGSRGKRKYLLEVTFSRLKYAQPVGNYYSSGWVGFTRFLHVMLITFCRLFIKKSLSSKSHVLCLEHPFLKAGTGWPVARKTAGTGFKLQVSGKAGHQFQVPSFSKARNRILSAGIKAL
jgi:hypothetical protein